MVENTALLHDLQTDDMLNNESLSAVDNVMRRLPRTYEDGKRWGKTDLPHPEYQPVSQQSLKTWLSV